MILKTYLRVFTENVEQSLALLQQLVGREVDMRFKMPADGLEIVAIGDFCLVGGAAEVLAPIRACQGPLIVDDLTATTAALLAGGAEITKPEAQSPSGRYLYARHPDGTLVEYVQWKPELVQQFITARRPAAISA